jgi:hypothetical protein
MDHMYLKKPEIAKKQLGSFCIVLCLVALPGMAMAADGSGIFCWVADYLKQIVGAAALVAIVMWSIEHIFGAAKLHDMVIRIGVACGLVIVGAVMIAKSGLTVNC